MLNRHRFERYIKRHIEQPLKYIHDFERNLIPPAGYEVPKYTLSGTNFFDPSPRAQTRDIYLNYRQGKNPVGYKLVNGMQFLCMNRYGKFKPGIYYNPMQKGFVAPLDFDFPALMTPRDTPENYKPVFEKLNKYPKSLPQKLVKKIYNRYQRSEFLTDNSPFTSLASTVLATTVAAKAGKSPWLEWAPFGAAVGFNIEKLQKYCFKLETVSKIETRATKLLYRLAKLLPRK